MRTAARWRVGPWLIARISTTYLDACRRKRNIAQYDHADVITAAESQALRAAAQELRDAVLAWLTEQHPELLGAP